MKSPLNRALLAALTLGLASGSVQALDFTATTFEPHDYSNQTLISTNTVKGGYYKVTDATDLGSIKFKTGLLLGSTDTAYITVTLTNMAFAGGVTIASGNVVEALTVAEGDTTALFRNSGQVTATADIEINLAGSAIGVKPGLSGGIKIEVVNKTVEDILGAGKGTKTITDTPKAVYGVDSIVQEVMGDRRTAQVSQNFKTFDTQGKHLAVTIGTVKIGPASPRGDDAADNDEVDTAEVVHFGNSKVKLVGDLSFVEKVTYSAAEVSGAATCSGTDMPIADGKSASVAVGPDATTSSFETAQHICIQAKKDTEIPTGSYTIDIDYAAGTLVTGVLNPLADVTEEPFGSIRHNGTTVHIPFVTTYANYNQRFMIVNNGPGTTYKFKFTPESGATAAAGTMAEGALPNGTTHLKAMDIVTVTGKTRTAATFTAVADPSDIEMSSVLVTKETGATDLTILEAEAN